MSRKKALVLGVGNILFTDEGIGVHAVNYLEKNVSFGDEVALLDGGTSGTALMDSIMNCEFLLVLDAVLGDSPPGSLYRLVGNDLRKSLSFRDSMHQTDLVDTLIYCELAGYKPEAVVIGMEPMDYQTMGLELSPVCRNAIPGMAQKALEELGTRGLYPVANNPQ